MIKCLKAPERQERAVAFYLNTLQSVKAVSPAVSTSYSDVLIEYNGKRSWLEVKLNENDQMGSPRVSYDGNRWTAKSSPIQNFTTQKLNSCSKVKDMLNDLSTFTKIENPLLPTTRGGLKEKSAVQYNDMVNFMQERGSLYLYSEDDVNLGDLITQHYNCGKKEPAHYIQAGDQFFALGDEDPLDLKVPKLEATGKFKVRLQFRKSLEWYEIMPEIKVSKLYSPFSVAPGTMKPHPFIYN
jgi:hypothetical protein